jgi:hypothetical protein
LPNPAGADAVIVTMRQKGVAAGSFDEFGTKYNFRTASFNDVDFVDACALDPKNAPLAAAAIGRDGTLVLFRDAIKDRNPLRIRFNSVVGDVYRVLSSHGHIVVLTSKGIFVLTGLAEHFLKDTRGGTFTTSVLVIPMEAFDADMGGERYLLVLTPDNDVCRIDMSRIEGETVSARSTSEFTPAEPKWEERAGEPEQRLAVAA